MKTATDSDLLEILDRTQGDVSVDDALIAMRAVRDAARQEAADEIEHLRIAVGQAELRYGNLLAKQSWK